MKNLNGGESGDLINLLSLESNKQQIKLHNF